MVRVSHKHLKHPPQRCQPSPFTSTLHDLNLAARYAVQFVVMDHGVVYASGDAASVLTPGMLRDVYGVNATVHVGSDGIPQITPVSSARSRNLR